MGLKQSNIGKPGKPFKGCEPTYMGLKHWLLEDAFADVEVASLPIWD